MSTFLLIPGAGGAGWFWHRIVPGADPSSGLIEAAALLALA
jgi:hypothetical protein